MTGKTFEINDGPEDEKKGLVHFQTSQFYFIGFTVVGLLVGVGLLCYYVPARPCREPNVVIPGPDPTPTPEPCPTDDPNPKTTTQASTTTPRRTTTTPPTTPDGRWPGRLPTNVLPHSYDLYLKPYINDEDVTGTNKERFTFDGRVTITVNCYETTDRITLHVNDIDIVDVQVFTEDGVDIFEHHWVEEEYEFLHLDMHKGEFLEPGNMYDVTIVYIGKLNDGLSGFYRSSYTNSAGEVVWGATSQMQPTAARRALPCYDEPGIKAMFNTTIEHRTHHIAITNGIELTEDLLPGGWTRTTFKPTPAMSSYLLAFTVGVFDFKETYTTNGVRFRTWSRPESVNSTYYALEVGSNITTYFEEYFGIDFPLEKQDMIAVPDFGAGAMENWGLIIYRESAMLYNPLVNSASNKQRAAAIISHELAHQWFGNLMTPKWWDDLWLNEGFASYVEYLGVQEVEPDWGMMEQFVPLDLQRAFGLDSLGSSHPVRVPVGSPEQISEIFDAISYSKGASILRMLDNILTEEVFRNGLKQFLKDFSYLNADSDDLWAALTKADEGIGNNDVKGIMDTWTLQMGYPLITFERNGDRVIAHQEHYLSDPSAGVDPRFDDLGYLWYVHLQYTHQSHGTDGDFENPFTTWIGATRNLDFTLDGVRPGDWYLVNTYQYGYYRVNYDEDNWLKLTAQLYNHHEVIPNENRAQLIDDALTLARTGNLSHDIALGLVQYMHDEEDYLPWEAFLGYTNYIASMFRRSGGFGQLQGYMRELVKPLYTKLGWEDSESVLEQYTRNAIIYQACLYRMDDCLEKVDSLYTAYMAKPEVNPISANLRNAVYCTAIREGGETEWEFGWNQYVHTTDTFEKDKWLGALGCSRYPWILNRYLLLAVKENSEIRTQDVRYAIGSVAENPVGSPVAWDFLRTEWDTIFNLYGGSSFSMARVISSISGDFNSKQELAELIDFGEGRDFGSGARTYEQSLERTRTNIKWMEDYEDLITNWLHDHSP